MTVSSVPIVLGSILLQHDRSRVASKFNEFSKYKIIESVKNVFQYIACVGGLVYVAVIYSMSVLCVWVPVCTQHMKEFDGTL